MDSAKSSSTSTVLETQVTKSIRVTELWLRYSLKRLEWKQGIQWLDLGLNQFGWNPTAMHERSSPKISLLLLDRVAQQEAKLMLLVQLMAQIKSSNSDQMPTHKLQEESLKFKTF